MIYLHTHARTHARTVYREMDKTQKLVQLLKVVCTDAGSGLAFPLHGAP